MRSKRKVNSWVSYVQAARSLELFLLHICGKGISRASYVVTIYRKVIYASVTLLTFSMPWRPICIIYFIHYMEIISIKIHDCINWLLIVYWNKCNTQMILGVGQAKGWSTINTAQCRVISIDRTGIWQSSLQKQREERGKLLNFTLKRFLAHDFLFSLFHINWPIYTNTFSRTTSKTLSIEFTSPPEHAWNFVFT